MKFEKSELPGVLLIRFAPIDDERGLFVDVYREAAFQDAGITETFTQNAIARSNQINTVRGLHFQRPPAAQSKIVRVQSGRVFDVVVDLRRGEATYGRHIALEMAADDFVALYVPVGCAHGYVTLSDEAEIHYAICGDYSPADAGGVLWNDPNLGIHWPIAPNDAILSEKDEALPPLSALPPIFE